MSDFTWPRYLATNNPRNIFEVIKFAFSLRRSSKAIEKAIYHYLSLEYKLEGSKMCLGLFPFLKVMLSEHNACVDDRIMQLLYTYANSLSLIILIIKSVCSLYGKKIRLHLYHSLDRNHTIQLCGNEKDMDTKYEIAIVYANMEYVMYPIDKKVLGKQKRSFWSTSEQDKLEFLIANNSHLAAKDLADQYLEENKSSLQTSKAIIEKIYSIK